MCVCVCCTVCKSLVIEHHTPTSTTHTPCVWLYWCVCTAVVSNSLPLASNHEQQILLLSTFLSMLRQVVSVVRCYLLASHHSPCSGSAGLQDVAGHEVQVCVCLYYPSLRSHSTCQGTAVSEGGQRSGACFATSAGGYLGGSPYDTLNRKSFTLAWILCSSPTHIL